MTEQQAMSWQQLAITGLQWVTSNPAGIKRSSTQCLPRCMGLRHPKCAHHERCPRLCWQPCCATPSPMVHTPDACLAGAPHTKLAQFPSSPAVVSTTSTWLYMTSSSSAASKLKQGLNDRGAHG